MQTFNLSFFKHVRDTTRQIAKYSWQILCAKFEKPQIRSEKDGLLFSPALFEPAHRRKENVREVSMLVLDIDHHAELRTLKTQLALLNSAHLIYSTHSHLRRTLTNENAEPRFRICLPLAHPIPSVDFLALWHYVKRQTGLPLDESAKDASRMFYTPAIAEQNSPYHSEFTDGAFMDWQKLPIHPASTNEDAKANVSGAAADSTAFEFHEDRHSELCRRIEAGGKATGRGGFEMKCPAHNGNGDSSLFYDEASKSVACLKKPTSCNYFEILKAFKLPNGKLPSREHHDKQNADFEELEIKIKPFPVPNEKCFHGLAGEFIRLVEPHTEASVMALLSQFLVYFGNIIGRSAHFKIEGDKHFTNLFCVLIGNTASGRKGTSWGRVKQVFKGIDAHHEKECLASGLASGEGLLYRVRDAHYVQKQNKNTKEIEDVLFDGGVSDKRLLTTEGEFAQVLRVQGREGNTLSTFIRNLWDHGTAQSMTKNSPLKTTDAHVSIVGHITRDELLFTLSEVESANGYANRFLFVAVERAKLLPFGSDISGVEIGRLQDKLSDAIEFAKQKAAMNFSIAASEFWAFIYERLETSRFGYLAKLTQRASSYVRRLSLIYALLDKSSLIEKPHLEAALAVWQYSEDSARYVFGERLDNQTAEKILAELKQRSEDGMTRTEIRNFFDRHISNEKLNGALALLYENKLAEPIKKETKGRSKEVWFSCARSVKSVESVDVSDTNQPLDAFNAFDADKREKEIELCPECQTALSPLNDREMLCDICLYTKAI